jgi:hypothetical protein
VTRRLISSATLGALLWPWLAVAATAVHVALDHGHHDHDGRAVAAAFHGHNHASGTLPHEHAVVPAQQGQTVLDAPLAVSAVRSALPPPGELAGRSPIFAPQRRPPTPTVSPPILRV